MVDRETTCFSVTVYNMVQGWGVKIGDAVAIPEPYVQPVNVSHKDQVSCQVRHLIIQFDGLCLWESLMGSGPV
jgi:Tetratricopeptide repeat protein 5 OB fold domain